MRDFLISLAKTLNIKEIEKFDDEELKRSILNAIENKNILEKSMFELAEDFACSTELSVRIISTLNKIIDKIHQEKNLYKFISYCFDELIKLIPAENISFWEKHPIRDYLVLRAVSGKIKFSDIKPKRISIKESLAGLVLTEEKYIYIPDVTEDERYNPKFSYLPIKSVLSVPIRIKNEVSGVVNFSHPQPNAFDEFCIFSFISFVNLLSAVITLFEFYKQNISINRRLKKEVRKKTFELQKLNLLLYKETITDPLTKIHNRKYFLQRLQEEFSRSQRYANSFCLVLFDLDNLKTINDKFGHLEGDRLLRLFAKILSKNKRKEDLIGRVGGDEFGCILIATNPEGAKSFAERIKEKFKEEYKKYPVSVSAGVGCICPGIKFKYFKNYREFYNKVDKTLLKAKKTKDTVKMIETEK